MFTSTWSSSGTASGVWDTKTDGQRLWPQGSLSGGEDRLTTEAHDTMWRGPGSSHRWAGAGEGFLRWGHGKSLLCTSIRSVPTPFQLQHSQQFSSIEAGSWALSPQMQQKDTPLLKMQILQSTSSPSWVRQHLLKGSSRKPLANRGPAKLNKLNWNSELPALLGDRLFFLCQLLAWGICCSLSLSGFIKCSHELSA